MVRENFLGKLGYEPFSVILKKAEEAEIQQVQMNDQRRDGEVEVAGGFQDWRYQKHQERTSCRDSFKSD